MTDQSHSQIAKILQRTLRELEDRGDIVICTQSEEAMVKVLCEGLSQFLPNQEISVSEFIGIRALIYQATRNSAFFDWEMPTLTGFSKEEFERIAQKLPKG